MESKLISKKINGHKRHFILAEDQIWSEETTENDKRRRQSIIDNTGTHMFQIGNTYYMLFTSSEYYCRWFAYICIMCSKGYHIIKCTKRWHTQALLVFTDGMCQNILYMNIKLQKYAHILCMASDLNYRSRGKKCADRNKIVISLQGSLREYC